jgi:hypothetical protein
VQVRSLRNESKGIRSQRSTEIPARTVLSHTVITNISNDDGFCISHGKVIS